MFGLYIENKGVLNMVNAKSMYSLAFESGTNLTNKIFENSDFKEHSLQRIKEEAERGLYFYNFSFREKMLEPIAVMLLKKIKPIIDEFEENEFKIVVKTSPSGSWRYMDVMFYWGFNTDDYKRIINKEDRFSEKDKILYYTD